MTEAITSVKEFTCPRCNKIFKNKRGLAAHMSHVHEIGPPKTYPTTIAMSGTLRDLINAHVMKFGYTSRTAFFLDAARNQMKLDNELMNVMKNE